jgi:hypothetical protein
LFLDLFNDEVLTLGVYITEVEDVYEY